MIVLLMFPGFCLIGISLIPVALVSEWAAMFAFFGALFLLFLAVTGLKLHQVGKNQKLDEEIRVLCQQLSKATSGAVTVEYRTAWTGFFKPRHQRICRMVAFVPHGPVQVQVQVPPGSGPGQRLEVQTPQGLQFATIPAGVGPGQTFTFAPGPPALVQTIPGQIQPAPVQTTPGQQITVQVPPGSGPGQQLEVQTSVGVQFATVPAGIGPGQTFAFIPGPPAPVQATSVQIQPAPVQATPGQHITVQVPPGSGPGQRLEVQTSVGVQFATVPAGIGPGQTFAFIPGPPAPVQASVVA